ncbi:2-C-methyl-D-erythritol 4-phosphate cytidylyltransferase [Actinomycetospora cinnamomea]|uniref:2-C-methyl-D-erythritol 4-phosphate cytidylyltransferase n=1 Tax=Actinomycetospora cinnamomea TaxID=663609 RepID=A0A2U1FLN6_9PSEU|nr:2-C-methyl-D-erythritol 4-phosphate cytidylyltransferase [Actinomycetospora cinnamomea]PVZ13036.1 2-C-methyl-D-erythritol 4-phosphate cytidylyltransferase [Actinomycetospora cinnamomea]
MTVAAIVPAAGRGERLGLGRPKALAVVGGQTLVARAVDGLIEGGVDVVVVAAPPGDEDAVREALDHRRATVVTGADDRVGSVAAALDMLPATTEVVVVHDAARCLCPPAVVRAVVEAVRSGHRAVVPATAVADTLKRTGPGGQVTATVDRSGLAAVQTPQGFAAATLRAAHEQARVRRGAGEPVAATDDAGLAEDIGVTVVTVPGDPRAFKVTTPLDLAMAEALVTAGPA